MTSTWIIVILDVVFTLFLLIGFFAGFARGVKRSALELGLALVGIVIVGFITVPITDAILGISITAGGTTSSLETFFVNMLTSDEGSTITKLVNSSNTLVGVLNKLPRVLLCSVVFLVLNLLMRLVMYIIYKIISACAFKSKKKEKAEGLKRNRWVGGAIGTVKMFIVLVVMFLPLTSLIKLADNVLQSPYSVEAADDENSSHSVLDDLTSSVPTVVKSIVSGIYNSAFGVINGAAGLDDFVFDSLSEFEIKGEKVQIRKELQTYLDLFRDVEQITNSTTSIKNINWNEIDSLYTTVTGSGFYKVIVLNVAGELVENYPTLIECFPSLGEYDLILDSIKKGFGEEKNYSLYFSSDIDHLYKAFTSLGKSGYLEEVIEPEGEMNAIDAVVILATDYAEPLSDAVDNVVEMNIFQDAFSPVLDFALSKISGNAESIFADANTNITNWENLKTSFKSIITEIGAVGKLIEGQGVKFGEMVSDLKQVLLIKNDIPSIMEKLGTVLDDINGLEIMKDNHDDPLFPKIFEKLGVGNLLEVIDGTQLKDYKDLLKNHLTIPVENLVSLDLYDTIANGVDANVLIEKFANRLKFDYLEKGEYSKFLEQTLLPIYQLNALRDIVFDEVINASKETNIINFGELEATNSDGSKNAAASYENWKTELPKLSQIITELAIKTVDDKTALKFLIDGGDINELVKKLEPDEIEKIIPPILEAKSTKPLKDKLSQTIVDSVKGMIGEKEVSLSLDTEIFTNAEPQTTEFVEIFKSFIKILQQSDDISNLSFKDLDATLLGELIEKIKLNAYRVDLSKGTGSEKTVEGATKSLFDALIEQATAEYDNVDILSLFKVEHVYQIDFNGFFTLVNLAKESNGFATEFWNVAMEGSKDEQSVDSLLDAVEQNQDAAKELLEAAENSGLDIELDEETQKKFETKLDELRQKDTIDDSILDALERLLGGRGE